VNWHRFDADQNRIRLSTLMPIQIRNPYPTSSYTQEGKYLNIFFTLMHSNASFSFLISITASQFGQHIEISWKKYSLSLHLVEMDTDPDS
jgi:hypothetical protein